MERGRKKVYYPRVDDIQFCHAAFNKAQIICEHPNWTLPESDKLFTSPRYEIKGLQERQQRLYDCKCELNNFKREEWRLHTKKRNLIANLLYTIQKDSLAELFIQSWPKIWEILHKYDLIPTDVLSVNSVHLSEAPGGFISALNHFLKQNRPTVKEFKWLATSLNPYCEENDPKQTINDDRLIRHTMDKWVFGPDNTGDLFKASVVDELIQRASTDEVFLVTADGSQENVGGGELTVIDLFYAESLAALKLLSKGGHFVIKIFTIFECETINLVYLICCAFEEVHQFKPVSSREATSETYLVCKGFKFDKVDVEFQAYLTTLEDRRMNENTKDLSMFPLESIPKDFLDRIQCTMDYFCDLQMNVIYANINSFPHSVYPHEHQRRLFIREEIERRFQKAYRIDPLARELRLAPFMEKQVERFEINNNYLGSWEDENVTKKSMTNEELKCKYRNDLEIVRSSFREESLTDLRAINWTNKVTNVSADMQSLRSTVALSQIQNSRFITKRLLQFFNDVITLEYSQLEGSVQVESVDEDQVKIILPITVIKRSLREHEDQFVEQLETQLRKFKSMYPGCENMSISFENVLLIGQRAVGLIYLISKIMQPTKAEIRLWSNGEITLANLNEEISSLILNELEEVFVDLKDKWIHAIVSTCKLRENVPDPFYDQIKMFNNFCCIEICEKVLRSDL